MKLYNVKANVSLELMVAANSEKDINKSIIDNNIYEIFRCCSNDILSSEIEGFSEIKSEGEVPNSWDLEEPPIFAIDNMEDLSIKEILELNRKNKVKSSNKDLKKEILRLKNKVNKLIRKNKKV